MEKAADTVANHMMNINRVFREKKHQGDQRGNLFYHRQHQLRKKKEKHIVKLVDEKHEDAYDFRLNYMKVKETFLD